MPKPARTKKPGRRPGSGRRPIPVDLYLLQWSSVVEMLKDGHSGRAIKAKHGTCAETVRHVRRFMIQGGWTPPVRVPKKTVRPPRQPRPPRVGMTAEERLQKHSGVAFCLRAGKTNAEVAELEHVSVNTVRVVRRALVVQGEMIDR
jgi:uncharacterized protein YerC